MNVPPCPACGANRTIPGACPGCGAVQGEGHVCPHCRGLTRVEPHPTLRWVCAACKGPKLPLPIADPVRLEASRVALRAAKPPARSPMVFIAGALYALGTLVALASTMTIGKALILIGAWVSFGFLLRARGGTVKTSEAALNRAYGLAIRDYAGAGGSGSATAKELAGLLSIDESVAEAELVAIAAEQPTRIEVDASGDVRYRVGEAPKSELEEFDERLAEAERAQSTRKQRAEEP